MAYKLQNTISVPLSDITWAECKRHFTRMRFVHDDESDDSMEVYDKDAADPRRSHLWLIDASKEGWAPTEFKNGVYSSILVLASEYERFRPTGLLPAEYGEYGL